jgi:CheY-like chemotaxis protein
MYGPANPELTVMDFNMPLLDGLKASREILTKNPDAPILMVTVFKSSQLADECKASRNQRVLFENPYRLHHRGDSGFVGGRDVLHTGRMKFL